jgi:ATP-binding cassette subfamily F protein 3
MFTIKDLSLQFGPQCLFNRVTATIQAEDRIGLVGANGTGKTTLLKILKGIENADSVELIRSSGLTIGYLPQEEMVTTDCSVYEAVQEAFKNILSLEALLNEKQLHFESMQGDDPAHEDLLHEIGHLQYRLEALEPQKMRSRIESVLSGLGFKPQDVQRPCQTFSGGWQMRIVLARLLLESPDLLLLDEPTNHLDLNSQRWLEQFLGSYKGAILMISHDQAFLDRLCNRIFHLHAGHLDVYRGNYTTFTNEADARKEQRQRAFEAQQREIAHIQEFIDRFRYKADKSALVQSRIKALEKIERITLEPEAPTLHFQFAPAQRSAQSVITLENVTKSYDALTVFSGLNLEIERGNRIAIVGNNGNGKSTLAKIMAGVEPIQSGTRTIGNQVHLSYFGQHQAKELPVDATVLEVAEAAAPREWRSKVRNLLGAFLFSGDAVFKRVHVLSGGEKNRLALARILLQPTNCLILDEPTNHLDIHSRAVLQKAIKQYDGTLIIVSHDRSFVDPLVTRTIDIHGGKLNTYAGNLSEYLYAVEQQVALNSRTTNAPTNTPKNSFDATTNPKLRRQQEALLRQQQAPLRKELQTIEVEIEQLEREIAELEDALAHPETYRKLIDGMTIPQVYQLKKDTLQTRMARWETIALQIEQA